jgi:ATP-dependent exoDNAse (exonuclease V) alpha subunit
MNVLDKTLMQSLALSLLSSKLSTFNQEMEVLKNELMQRADGTLNLKKILLEKKIASVSKELGEHIREVSVAQPSANIFQFPQRKQTDPMAPEPLEESEEVDSNSEAVTYIDPTNLGKQESFALNIVLNDKQLIAKEMAMQGKSFVLIGAAGTGKTTAQREVAKSLLLDNKLSTSRFKSSNGDGERTYVSAPSIAFCAFTRRAAGNLRKAIHKDPILAEKLAFNVMTIHSLLEFEPETYEDYNEEGKLVEKFRFAPKRNANNPLNITHLVIEEASMLDAYTLWQHLYEALPPNIQIIFIGDINQLPPVFGPSILNYALIQLPIVELTEVYRNQGIVLENAHNILAGKKLAEDENFKIVRGKNEHQVGQDKTAQAVAMMFNTMLDTIGNDGLPEYDPEDCIILTPFNKQPCGSINLNNWIAQHLGQRRGAIVHEVIAGFNKLYLAVGDKVMVNKMDGVIIDIYPNSKYYGKVAQTASPGLTRFGQYILGAGHKHVDFDAISSDYSNFSLEKFTEEKADRKQQASHTITVQMENGSTEKIESAGDLNDANFSLGYALTVHKAQGSEWRKVFIILHKDHATMLYRELFYTAVTRARTKVAIIAKDFVVEKAIANQRIKGNSIADKIEFFNKDLIQSGREVTCLKVE